MNFFLYFVHFLSFIYFLVWHFLGLCKFSFSLMRRSQSYSLGTMTVEAVYRDRDRFAQLVREVAAPDLGRMGMEILSFTIKDVIDAVDYLESLGKSQTAAAKKDAEVGYFCINLRLLLCISTVMKYNFPSFELSYWK